MSLVNRAGRMTFEAMTTDEGRYSMARHTSPSRVVRASAVSKSSKIWFKKSMDSFFVSCTVRTFLPLALFTIPPSPSTA